MRKVTVALRERSKLRQQRWGALPQRRSQLFCSWNITVAVILLHLVTLILSCAQSFSHTPCGGFASVWFSLFLSIHSYYTGHLLAYICDFVCFFFSSNYGNIFNIHQQYKGINLFSLSTYFLFLYKPLTKIFSLLKSPDQTLMSSSEGSVDLHPLVWLQETTDVKIISNSYGRTSHLWPWLF